MHVRSFEDVHRWLGQCEYTSDMDLFHEDDFWQHPRTFEHLRRGDCEDFALWAWRKLVELGYDAVFIVGHRTPSPRTGESKPSDPVSGHAWVIFRRDGDVYIYEPTQRKKSLALQPLELVRDRYIPEFGVGPDRRSFAFSGYLLTLREKRMRKRERRLNSSNRTT